MLASVTRGDATAAGLIEMFAPRTGAEREKYGRKKYENYLARLRDDLKQLTGRSVAVVSGDGAVRLAPGIVVYGAVDVRRWAGEDGEID